MVKSLADELTEVLNWIEDARLTEFEHARSILVAFCRGLVCGLRTGNTQAVTNEEYDEGDIAKCIRDELKEWHHKQNVPDACDSPMMGNTPVKEERLKDS